MGNSGGGLINAKGELIGIITTIKSYTGRSTGYSFAIPATIIQQVIADIENYGAVQYAMFGMSFYELNSYSCQRARSVNKKKGLYVTAIDTNGIAHNAGIRPSDIIMRIGDVDIYSCESMMKELLKYDKQDTLILYVNRLNEIKQVRIPVNNDSYRMSGDHDL